MLFDAVINFVKLELYSVIFIKITMESTYNESNSLVINCFLVKFCKYHWKEEKKINQTLIGLCAERLFSISY